MNLVLSLVLALATVTDVQPHQGAGVVINSGSIGIPVNTEMFMMSVQIGDMIYSADFEASRKLKPSDFIVGDQVQAEVKKGKLYVQRKDGKTASAKIVRQQRAPAARP